MRLLGRILSTGSVLVLLAISTGQAQAIDSLVNLVKETSDDKVKADLFHRLASESWDYDFEKGLDFSRQSYKAAKRVDYKKGIAIALSDIGLYYYFVGELEKAKDFYRQSLQSSVEPGTYQATIHIRIGNLHRESSQFDSARISYGLASSLLKDSEPTRALSLLYHNVGWLNYELAEYSIARQFFRKALKIRTALKDSLFMAESWKTLGAVASAVNDFDSAQWYFNKVKQIALQYHNPELMIFYNIYQGDMYFKKGDFIPAIKMFTTALDSLAKHDYKRYNALVMKNIGQVFEWQGNYDNALTYFYDALRIEESIGSRLEQARTYDMMGWVFVNQRDFVKAKEIARASRERFREVKDSFGLSHYYTLAGYISFKENKFSEARKYYDSALVIRRKVQVPILTVNVLNFMTELLIAQKSYDKAVLYERQAFAIYTAVGNRNGIASYYNNMSKLMLSQKLYDSAQYFARLGLREAGQIKSTADLRTAYSNLSTIYTGSGKFEQATYYFKKYIQLSDSLQAVERASKQAQYNALYELENREAEIEDLNQQNVIQQTILEGQKSQLRFQNTVLVLVIMACALLASLAFTLYLYYKNKSKANEALSKLHNETLEQKEEIQAQSEELIEANDALVRLNNELLEKTEEIATQSEELRETNDMISAINRDLDEIVTKRTSQLKEAYKELDTFFYRSSHDFRRPLTTFMGLAEVASVTVKDQNALDLFDKVKETARSLDKMLVKLQSISDVGAQQLVFKEVLITEIFDNVCQSFREEIQVKGIKASCKVVLKNSFISYPAMIKVIIDNLVENAIQFSMTENPYFRLTVTEQENSVVMVMEDNGQGIAKEYADRVFDMYFRGSERSKGNGLGLYIVKKAIEKLDGSIHLETNYGIGSRFTITIPVHDPEGGWSHL